MDCDEPTEVLDVRVYDYDVVGADDFMGLVRIPLDKLGDKLFHKRWYPLTNKKGEIDQVKGKSRGEIEIGIWWMYSEEKAAKYGMDLTDDKKEMKKERAILEENEAN